VVREEAGRFTLVSTDGADQQVLLRRVAEHLHEAKGWEVTWYDWGTPNIPCRPVGRIANPYRLCVSLDVEPGRSSAEVRFGYSNPHDPIYD
jgi:hypothetical protein